jgi:hypothetical protein
LVFERERGTQVGVGTPAARLRGICEELGLRKHYLLDSLRKYRASTVVQQGLDGKSMIKMLGQSDFELILRRCYAKNDDTRLVAEACKIDFGLGFPRQRDSNAGLLSCLHPVTRLLADLRDGCLALLLVDADHQPAVRRDHQGRLHDL